MTNKAKPSYTEILADTLGNMLGFAMVAGGGAALAATTTVASATAGVTVATGSTAYNQFCSPENQIDTYDRSFTALKTVAELGYNTFDRVQPLLFSTGHMAGSIAVKATALTVRTMYANAKSMYNSSVTEKAQASMRACAL